MNCWSGKIAVVTGASQGIGLAISKELASYDIKVIGLSRRMDKLMEVAASIGQYFVPLECDITEEDAIAGTFKWIEENFGGVDILVNNAATCSLSYIMESEEDEIEDVVKTNLIAPAILAREALNSMRKRGTRGHIINISGTPGLYLEAATIPMGMYDPTKYGLRVLGIVLRHEIAMSKLNVKVTTINPGLVRSTMFTELYSFFKIPLDDVLKDRDIAETVICVLATSDRVEISEIRVLPQGLGSSVIALSAD